VQIVKFSGRVLGKSRLGLPFAPCCFPVPCGALTVIGASTLPKVRDK